MPVPNTLGLDDDLDGVELVENVEAAFDLRIPNADAERIQTVGELYDWLVGNMDERSEGKKCASAMAFYRVRRAIRRLGFDPKITPSADLGFLENGNLKANFADLEKETGLRMPAAVPTRVTLFGCLLMGTLIVATVVSANLFKLDAGLIVSFLMLAFGFGWVVARRDPGKLSTDCSRLSGLVKKVSVTNYGRLVKMGASHNPEVIWNVLLDLLSGYRLSKSEITRDTLFLESQLKKRAAA